jgi:hypothetical protein
MRWLFPSPEELHAGCLPPVAPAVAILCPRGRFGELSANPASLSGSFGFFGLSGLFGSSGFSGPGTG